MASNEDVFSVADGLLDEQQYLTENLADVGAVIRYAESLGIELSTGEANRIIEVIHEYHSIEDDGQWVHNFYSMVVTPLMFWDREETVNEV